MLMDGGKKGLRLKLKSYFGRCNGLDSQEDKDNELS